MRELRGLWKSSQKLISNFPVPYIDLTLIEFRIVSHLVIACFIAGVVKILRSLLPFPIMDKISELT
jgi:hypothetical protein